MKPSTGATIIVATLEVSSPADVTVIDPDCEWTIDASTFHSLSRNTPFDGKEVKSKAVCTLVGGEVKTPLAQ